MRHPDYSGQFKRDVKQAQKRGKDMNKLKALLALLIKGKSLPAFYLAHPLKGEWRGFLDGYYCPTPRKGKKDCEVLLCKLSQKRSRWT